MGEKGNWQEELGGFVSRNINDTRYIAKMLVDCVNFELSKDKGKKETKVQGISGSLTYYLRKKIFDYSSPFLLPGDLGESDPEV